MNHWKGQLQLKKITIATFLDLKRAFETIDRRILLKKLKRYGKKGTVLKNFENYSFGIRKRQKTTLQI
jgi:hypothetical protein